MNNDKIEIIMTKIELIKSYLSSSKIEFLPNFTVSVMIIDMLSYETYNLNY